MDERERRSAEARRVRQQGMQRRRPGSSTRRTGRRPETDRTSEHPSIQRSRRRSSRARRRRRNMIIRMFLLIIVIIAVIAGFIFWKRYGSSNEKADLNQYYGLVNEDDIAVVVNNQVVRSTEDTEAPPPGKMFDGTPYIEYSVVRDRINKRIYWDSNENVLLYTLPNGNVTVEVGSKEYTEINETKSEEYVILKTEGKTAYIALPFIQHYTNMTYSVYEQPGRAVITSEWGKVQTAKLKRDTEVRYQGGVKSPILTEVEKSDKVTVLEDEDDWQKVATNDGFIGYVKTSSLKDEKTETFSNEFEEPVYTNISENHTINMAWHNVENEDANNYVLETIARTKGLTTIAPTWFNLADTEGNISSIANSEYVNYAHQSKLEVWAVLRDFHGGINSYDETYQVLSYTSKRANVINQVIAAALQSGVDGINLDFELISNECGEHYIQFVRELSVKCRQNGLVFSVDNYVPQPYNEHYDLEEQGIMADYVIIMAYDEHTEGSYEAGSVSSYEYVKTGIEDALKKVSNTKLIAGIPFYTRLWLESPKTEEDLAQDEGTEAANYPNKVTSSALGMDEAADMLQSVGVQAEWDDTAKQNYAQWETDEGVYKIWLEDSTSIEEKLKLIKQNKLAGVAEWKIGWENASVWDLILQYVN
ncbi:SH3 domain-containing protein [Mediterraneibacter sp. NSJ-55]|uniref:SH3 domain-containing protein n=1 Tax=Mediterraneibacter hominis TaxID=2763054 RepID=A0A923LJJ8_9FIRM|nr:glycosyl hydrolase family 18 protein [Mediterraneibacter hominis]MBC5689154.1 SH3 domain-containing protein [Mediterraneibacter hominis]